MKPQGAIAISIGAIGFITFTVLLVYSKVWGATYLLLLSLLAIVCLVVPVLGRLKQLDLKNLKQTLEKIEAVKNEIYAKEESLKASSQVLAELIAATSALSCVYGDSESSKLSMLLIKSKLQKLAESLNFGSKEKEKIFMYEKSINEVLSAEGNQQIEKFEEFKNLLKSEAEKT